MSATVKIKMRAGERIPFSYDFSNASDRPSGVNVSSASVAAYELPALTTVTSTILDSATATVASNIVTIRITTPTANKRYKIVTTATGSDTWWKPIEVLEIEVGAA
jgi:hypothetical protein